MVGAVVIGAVGGEHRQPVGVVVGAHQMVAGRFARRIRAVGFVAVGLGEGGLVLFQRAVDFVGGDVEKTEVVLGFAGEAAPVGTDGSSRPNVPTTLVRMKSSGPSMERSTCALGGKVDDGAELVFGEQSGNQAEVADIAADKT